ncbi:MAG: hypothetical protein M1829_005510 [Trizodia sp. TS-e1964]|nr:MAG: hypothetical protein M1829_005510 [Trizodia sp. TS-e1964]
MAAPAALESTDDLKGKIQQSPLASKRNKSQAEADTAANRGGRFANFFPMGFKEGFQQWWANVSPAAAEHAVLSRIPYLQQPPTHTQTGSAPPSTNVSKASISHEPSDHATPVTTNSITDPYGSRKWFSELVELSGNDRALNEFSVERVGEDVKENLVMLHGYGAGLGFFYKNFEGLSRVQGWKVYGLDLLGMGRSSRPPFRVLAKDREAKITEAENWFIDALEEWRIIRKIDRFTLLGHSLGGYMAVAYALKYPGHLKKLILASPVGIPEDPYAVNADMPEPEESTMANEFTQDQDNTSTSAGPIKKGDNNNFLNARAKGEKDQANAKPNDKAPAVAPRRPLPKWLTYLWDANISPFSIVRWSGPLGPRFVSGWTSRRFSHLPSEEANILHMYSYTLFRQRGSGEYALSYVLAPGAFARSPLIRRIQGVGRQYFTPTSEPLSSTPSSPTTDPAAQPPKVRETGIPVVMMYGENDWMDIAGGYAAEQKFKEEKERVLRDASAEEKARERGEAKVIVIGKAGHHLYLDNWEEFNEVMRNEMEEVSRAERGGVS